MQCKRSTVLTVRMHLFYLSHLPCECSAGSRGGFSCIHLFIHSHHDSLCYCLMAKIFICWLSPVSGFVAAFDMPSPDYVFSFSASFYRKCPSTPSLSRPPTWRATWTLACPTQPQPLSALPTSTTIPQNWQSERWVLNFSIDFLLICVSGGGFKKGGGLWTFPFAEGRMDRYFSGEQGGIF